MNWNYIQKMKNPNKVLFVISFLIGCSSPEPKVLFVDKAFTSYVEEFIHAGASVNHPVTVDNLIIVFSTELDDDILGVCEQTTDGTPRIQISLQNWVTSIEIEKKAVVFHELGHCVLWLDHDEVWINTLQSDNVPRSLMYPYIEDAYIYTKYWNYYINELFNGPQAIP